MFQAGLNQILAKGDHKIHSTADHKIHSTVAHKIHSTVVHKIHSTAPEGFDQADLELDDRSVDYKSHLELIDRIFLDRIVHTNDQLNGQSRTVDTQDHLIVTTLKLDILIAQRPVLSHHTLTLAL